MKTEFTVAIIGCGQRGLETYARLMKEMPERFRFAAVCDIDPERLRMARTELSLSAQQCFPDEQSFFAERRADLLLVTTQDADHVRHASEGLRLGYDILCEKPITASREEAMALLALQKETGHRVVICHVLRYAPAFTKLSELLNAGSIGRLVAIEATEQVAYWHQAHSFVRGNWRRAEDTTPMILAKCCHDLDLLQHYAGARCLSVSSVGSLSFFKEANAPGGSAARCPDCALRDSCPYSACRFYLGRLHEGSQGWPLTVLTNDRPITEASLLKALQEGPYGRCVFRCDNTAVDHQLVQMNFENGVKACLTMTAFTKDSGRLYALRGTLGELLLNEERGLLTLKRFGGETESWRISDLVDTGTGHGGGDSGLLESLYRTLCEGGSATTALEASIESHLIGFAAERSRLAGGQQVYVHEEKTEE